jgi:cobalt-zinc-cadmium efflux system outer membrane protein
MRAKSASILLLIGVTGCATIRPRAGFDDVERLMASRTSGQVAWKDGADGAVEERVRELLASELTPDAAVQLALLNSPALLATYERLGIAQADLVQAGLLPNPVIHASVRFAVSGPGPGAELSLLQDVIGMLVIPLRKRVAAAEFEVAKLEVAQTVIDLVTDVKAAFYALQGAQQMVELRRIVAETTQLSADIARRQHEAGNVTDLDLANEQTLAAQAKIDLAQAEAEALAGREELNALLGLWGQRTGCGEGGRRGPGALPRAHASDGALHGRGVRRRCGEGAWRHLGSRPRHRVRGTALRSGAGCGRARTSGAAGASAPVRGTGDPYPFPGTPRQDAHVRGP